MGKAKEELAEGDPKQSQTRTVAWGALLGEGLPLVGAKKLREGLS